MKQITLFIGLLLFSVSCNTNTANKSDNRIMAFQKGQSISIYHFSTGKTKELIKGYDPCISPDGKWVAYTASTKGGGRKVKLINTETSEKKDLKVTNQNNYGGVWSPTGEYLAINIFAENWDIGIINPNKIDFQRLTSDKGLYSPTWSHDGKFILAHDLYNLYKFNVNGKLIKQYNLEELSGDRFNFSSATQFYLSSDNQKLIFESAVDETIIGKELPSSIFCYDLTTKEVNRLTPKGLSTYDVWVDKQDNVYFAGFKNTIEPRKIYQTSLTDTTLIKLLKKGIRPSIGHSK